MNAYRPLLTTPLWAALLILGHVAPAAAAPVGYQSVSSRDFFNKYGFGTLGIFPKETDKTSSNKVTVIFNRRSFRTERRAMCTGIIQHRNPAQVGLPTYVGLQIIRVFSDHASPGAVYVSRIGSSTGPASWRPRAKDLKNVDKLPPKDLPSNTEIRNATFSDFAHAHSSTDESEISQLQLTYTDDGSLAGLWHAKLSGPGAAAIDTASIDDRKFWAVDALNESFFKDNAAAFGSDYDVRIENRLVSFQITDAKSWQFGPQFFFRCDDPNLLAVFLRVFVPAVPDSVSWYEIEF